MKDIPDLIYRINAQDEIVYVNEAWDLFALSNGAPHLIAEHVLQRPLWEFISDATTRELYQQAIALTRQGRTLRFPFRCDSPQERRFMEMILSPYPGDMVTFRSITLRIEPRPCVPLLDMGGARTEGLVRMCSWCKRIAVDDTWVEIEEGITRLRLFERATMPQVTHGICEACLERLMNTLVA